MQSNPSIEPTIFLKLDYLQKFCRTCSYAQESVQLLRVFRFHIPIAPASVTSNPSHCGLQTALSLRGMIFTRGKNNPYLVSIYIRTAARLSEILRAFYSVVLMQTRGITQQPDRLLSNYLGSCYKVVTFGKIM